MTPSPRSFFPVLITLAVAAAVTAGAVYATTAPRGWHLAGSNPRDYQTGIDDVQFDGHRVAYLKATATTPKGFVTLMQRFRADDYLGRKVRFTAMLKPQDVANWAGLWMRVDKGERPFATPRMLAFDNMHDRPVTGTQDWKKYEVTLGVPEDASAIYFGVLLNGSGNISVTEPKIEIVGFDGQPGVKPTSAARPVPFAPTNLDFEP
jgi:hypothetical protein